MNNLHHSRSSHDFLSLYPSAESLNDTWTHLHDASSTLPPTKMILAILATILVVVLIFNNHINNRAFAAFAAANGHQDPNLIPNKFFLSFTHKLKVLKFKGDFLDDFVTPKYNTWGRTHAICNISGHIKAVNTIEPENMKALMATRFQDFDRPNIFKVAARPWIGPGIFMSDGTAWARGKALLRPHFHNRRFNDLTLLSTHFDDFVRALGPVGEGNWTGEVDLLPLFQRFTMDSSTEFLFGTSAGSQLEAVRRSERGIQAVRRVIIDPSNPPAGENFSEAFDNANQFVGIRLRLGNLAGLWSTANFKANCKITHDYADNIIRARASRDKHLQEADEGNKYGLLDSILRSTSDHIDVRSQLLNVLIAGRDTTAALLSWLIAELLVPRNRHILERLRQEVNENFGSSESGIALTFESLKASTYLQWVFLEGNRLYPALTVNARLANKDTVLPVGGGKDGLDPIAIRKGTRVNFCAYLLQRRKDIWGEDANEFNPERWNGRKVGYEYIPFSAGPRTCIGQAYAQASVGFMIVRILQTFDQFETMLPEDQQLRKCPRVTTTPLKGVRVRMHMSARN